MLHCSGLSVRNGISAAFFTGILKVAYYKRSKQFNFYLICLLLSASAVTFKSVRRPVFESLHSVHLLHFDEF